MRREPRDLLILIMALYAAAYFVTMRMPFDILLSPIAGSDLSSYYTGGYLVRTGQAGSLYAVAPGDTILGDATAGPYAEAAGRLGLSRQHYYIYPPFFAILVAPLSLLPFAAARLMWLAVDLGLLCLFAWTYIGWRRDDGEPVGVLEAGLMVIVLFLEFLPLIWALAIGQTTVLLLALLALTMRCVKGGRESLAGLFLGLATAIKLTPALLIVYFLVRGRARTAWWAALVFLLCNGLGVVLLGPAVNVEFYRDVMPEMSAGTSYFLNQSLAGLFDRMLDAGDMLQVPLATSAAARVLAIVSGLVLLVVTGWALHRRAARAGRRLTEPVRGLALDLEVSAVLLLTLLLSPISWSHHYVLVVIPVFTIVAAAGRMPTPRPWLAVALGIAFLLIARKPHPDLFMEGFLRLGLSASLGGALVLWGACLYLLSSPDEGPHRSTGVARAA